MRIADLFIRRPVFATMLVAAAVVLGLFSYRTLGVDLFPNVDFPIVTVTTTLKGAGVEETETGVTKVLEEAINTIEGIEELRSTTREGVSVIVVSFVLEKSREVAAQDVRDKVASVLAQLPTGTDSPVIDKFDVDAVPVMTIAVSGRRSLREVTELARRQVKEVIETLPGVGQVILLGGQERAINIFVDPDRLTAQGLSVGQVREAIARQNVELPGGRLDQTRRELSVRTMGRLETVRDFNDLIVAHVGERPLHVRDLGYAEDGIVESRSLTRLNGEHAVQLVVRKQSGTNTVQVIAGVKTQLAKLRTILPPDIELQAVRDQSRFITSSIDTVREHLWLGGLLVAFTVLLFMRDWRSTIVAGLAIPTSIIATFTLMRAFGFTLNNLTMLALVLAVGIVIDDAVVVLENIFRRIQDEGEDPDDGGVAGHGGDRPGGDGHHAVAGDHLSAGGVHGGAGRPVLPQLRDHHGRGDHGVPLRLLHSHAGLERAHAAAAVAWGARGPPVSGVGTCLRRPAPVVAAASVGDRAHRGGVGRVRGPALRHGGQDVPRRR